MDLDDISRWSRRGHGAYPSPPSRGTSDAHGHFLDPVSPRRYFNDDRPPAHPSARRVAPPPPPPPPPSPPPSTTQKGKKSKSTRSPHNRHARRAVGSAASSSGADTAESSSRTSSSSDKSDGTSGSHTNESGSSSNSGSRSCTSSSTSRHSSSSVFSSNSNTSSDVSHPRGRRSRQRRSHRSPSQLPAKERFSRVGDRPMMSATHEELAAVAACQAILAKEARLKEEELRLLQQKRNFAAEVQRRSLQPHYFVSEDEALRHMQRLVALQDTTPALEEYLKRTAKPLPPSGALTDAGALAYLRSGEVGDDGNEMAVRGDGFVVSSPKYSGDDDARSERRSHTRSTAGVMSRSPSRSPQQRSPSAAPTLVDSDGTPLHNGVIKVESPRTSSSPAGVCSQLPPDAPTLQEQLSGQTPSEATPAAAPVCDLNIERKSSIPAAVTTIVPIAAQVRDSNGSSSTAKREGVGSTTTVDEAASQVTIEKGPYEASKIISIGVPHRRIKVKVRRQRNQPREEKHPSRAEGSAIMNVEHAHAHKERDSDAVAASPFLVETTETKPGSVLERRELLPPLPSPASHGTDSRQRISIDPLQQHRPVGAAAQPWTRANWPCSLSPSTLATAAVNPKKAECMPATWYASNSAVPLPFREFKDLLCSEYVSPDKAVLPQAGEAGASASATATSSAKVQRSRVEFEPYDNSGDGDGAAPPASGLDGSDRALPHSERVRDAQQSAAPPTPRPPPLDREAAPQTSSPAVEPLPQPPGTLLYDDEEAVIEFPPPPHMRASDMPPPGDVGSVGEDSCCGCDGRCGVTCCSCWTNMLLCLFPCCCRRRRKSEGPATRMGTAQPVPLPQPTPVPVVLPPPQQGTSTVAPPSVPAAVPVSPTAVPGAHTVESAVPGNAS